MTRGGQVGFAAALLLATTALQAQRVDFSGAWMVDSAKTGIASLPA